MSLERLSPGAPEADIRDVVSVLTEAFGGGFTEDRIRELSGNQAMYVAVARVDGTIAFVGMGCADADVDAKFRAFGEDAVAPLLDRRVGVVESLATATAARRRGLAGQAITFLADWLREQGCEVVAAASWGTGGPDTSRGLFERRGFVAVRDIPGETYRVTNLEGRPCPVCGIPCRCSGTLLVLKPGETD